MSATTIESKKNLGTVENGILYPSQVMLDLNDLKKVYPTPKGDYVVLEHFGSKKMQSKHLSNLIRDQNKLIFLFPYSVFRTRLFSN